MNLRKIHYYTGLFLSIFITLHLGNHLFSLISPEKHIEVMKIVRLYYRNALIEPLLIITCLVQAYAGINLYRNKKKYLRNGFDKIHVYSGLYLIIFLTLHPGAIFVGRLVFGVDTNFWFAAMTVNLFPMLLFFIPYYFLGTFAFFAHVACIHRLRTKALGWKNSDQQAKMIMGIGAVVAFLIIVGMTGYFSGLEIPEPYNNLY